MEGDVVGPVLPAGDLVLDGEIVIIDGEAVVAGVEGVALATGVGGEDDVVVALGEGVAVVGVLGVDEEWSRWGWLALGLEALFVGALEHDEVVGE